MWQVALSSIWQLANWIGGLVVITAVCHPPELICYSNWHKHQICLEITTKNICNKQTNQIKQQTFHLTETLNLQIKKKLMQI